MRVYRPSTRASRRRGGVVLEFLIAMPVFLIAMFAVIQYAVFFANMQQVGLASRVGAEAASQIVLPNELQYGQPPTTPNDTVPPYIVEAIFQQLSSSGITPCCIILDHNANTFESPPDSDTFITPQQRFVTEIDSCYAEPPTAALPPRSVRVTVVVKLPELMPNCLGVWGFDVASKTAQHTATFRYEL